MRLIDADELIKAVKASRRNNPHKNPNVARNHHFEHSHFILLISEQPTAYDVNAVIAKLEKERKTRDEKGMCILASVDFITAAGIVRNGGKKEAKP